MTTAWMLRQDGEAFPVKVHLYVMGDANLSSEAEAASFIYLCGTQDKELAEEVITAWVAELINPILKHNASEVEILEAISNAIQNLPYRFAYPLSEEEILDICDDSEHFVSYDALVDYLFDLADKESELSAQIKLSLNQQFARTRFGGQYNTVAGNAEMWCRVSSIGYNWANTFYEFITRMRKKYDIQYVTICRDAESDYQDLIYDVKEYFYKAKDGTPYYHMPIEEYLVDEHETSPVFSTTDIGQGVRYAVRCRLANGETILSATKAVFGEEQPLDILRLHKNYVSQERANCFASDLLTDDQVPAKTKRKIMALQGLILKNYEGIITGVTIDYQSREGYRSGENGFELNFFITSNLPKVDGVELRCHYNHPLSQTEMSTLFRQFRQEFSAYVEFGM